MKRLIYGVAVIALLSIGAGLLAGIGSGSLTGHAATGPRHHEQRTPSATATPRPPRSHLLLAKTATALPRAAATATTDDILTRHPLTHAVTQVATHTVTSGPQVVDPASITLPPTGPLLLLNPNTAAAGATINVLGSGFDAGKLVTLTLDTGTTTPKHKHQRIVLDTAQAGRDGDFSKTLSLPSSLSSHSFWVLAQERKGTAFAQAQGSIAIGSPTATLSTAVGKPGDIVYASARGFDPNEAVDVFLNNLGTAPVVTLHTDGGGGLSLAAIPVPYGPVGPTALLLLGRHSRGLAAIPFEMLGLYPAGSISSYAAVADTLLRFNASGFGPDEDVDVRVNTPDGFAVGKLHTDSSGTIRSAGHFRIPFSLKGRNTFVLTGEQSHTSTTVAFTVEPYTPIAAPSSYGGGPGTAITFYGTGFARHETVRVWLGRTGAKQVATLQTDGLGNLIARPGLIFIEPNTPPGKLVFILAGDKSVTPTPVTFNVQTAGGPVVLGASAPSAGQ